MNKKKIISFADCIRDSLDQNMSKYKNLITFGEGIDDPSSMFGTTKGLRKKHGLNRTIEMPLSENCMVGAAIGASMMGDKVVVNLQRVEFALLALEQIINNAAKTHYLSNGKHNVDIVIRLIVGRGWGQGPEHSQTLESLFASIPGLKVFMPAFPFEAYQLMNLAIKDPNPIIFIENRWSHYTEGNLGKLANMYDKSFSKLSNGDALTLISSGYTSTVCFQIVSLLKKYNINIDFFNLKIIRPLNITQIKKSMSKTKKIIIIDSGHKILGIGSEIIAKLAEENYKFNCPPIRLGMPDHPTPSSRSFIDKTYVDSEKILKAIFSLINISKKIKNKIIKENNLKNNNLPKDIPDPKFKGPF
jgi:pyruvate/2-oxoglutarate/acetoin dehydrogenase E1 component